MASADELYNHVKSIPHLPFMALDVETANKNPNSICQISIAWVEGDVVHGLQFPIKPPTKTFEFTHLHGITYDMVKDAKPFADVWDSEIVPMLRTNVLCAHYANFDMKAIKESYEVSGRLWQLMDSPVRDSCILARKYFPALSNYKLPTVCQYLGISLDHHNSLSDAMACANIINWMMHNCQGAEKCDFPFVAAIKDSAYKMLFFGPKKMPAPLDTRTKLGRLIDEMMKNKVIFYTLRVILILGFIYIIRIIFK